jgi:hypothetical protein
MGDGMGDVMGKDARGKMQEARERREEKREVWY